MKYFFDRIIDGVIHENLERKPAVAFECDRETTEVKGTLLSIEKLMTYFLFDKVAGGIVCQGKPGKAKIEECKKVGIALAEAGRDLHARAHEHLSFGRNMFS